MTLEEKLDAIAKTSTVKRLNKYPNVETAKDFDELWKKVIEPNLPDKNTVLEWHNLLMKYIQQDNAVFTLRKYGSGDNPRRGFLNRVVVKGKELFETFYTDNSVPFYFYSMAKDGFVPDFVEFNDAMIKNRTFPYGYFPSSVSKIYAAYPNKKNPGINTKGYKLAHIFSAGENYDKKSGYTTISNFCEEEFPNADVSKWDNVLPDGTHYRPIYIDSDKKAKVVKDFSIAHFLRSVHPINYFLVPLTTNKGDIKKTNIYWYDYGNGGKEEREIGEYSKLIEYVTAKIKEMYKDVIGISRKSIYQEFLDLIYPTDECINPIGDNYRIDAEYAIDIWKKKIGISPTSATASSKGATSSTATFKTRTHRKHPEIPKEFLPNDLNLFEKELLDKKKAKITLTYADGHTMVHYWDARKYKSNLNASVYCQLRDKPDRDQIVKAVFEV